MAAAALLALALAAQDPGSAIPLSPRAAAAAVARSPAPAGQGPGEPGAPCTATDRLGRTFRVCFDPGAGLDLSAGAAFGREEPAAGGATDLRVVHRWREDLRSRSGELEWVRDMAFVEARALFTAGDREPVAARALAWRGVFVRHRASPFLLIPGPRPLRLPFPFDVGLLAEVGGAAWERARPREVDLAPLRAALLLDLGGGGRVRRLAFGPEVAWTVRLSERAGPVHGVVPFTAGVVDARLESADGLATAAVALRAGSSVSVPGGAEPFLEALVAVERVVLAVNDRPVALYAEGVWRGGASGRGGEVGAGLRLGLGR